jgi:hypothetical protein
MVSSRFREPPDAAPPRLWPDVHQASQVPPTTVISEVMYDPCKSLDSSYEWLEIWPTTRRLT